MISNVEARIIPRVSAEGHPFSEILHSWKEDGTDRFACSRVRWAVSNTSYARAAEVAAFMKRRDRHG